MHSGCCEAVLGHYVLANGIIFSSDLSGPHEETLSVIINVLHLNTRSKCAWCHGDTHNHPTWPILSTGRTQSRRPLTWPGREFDQIGTASSVEQGHCTLVAVKRYRDPPRIGGRHNFLLRPTRSSPKKNKSIEPKKF